MRNLILAIVLITAANVAKAQPIDSSHVSKYYFGLSLTPNNNTIITYGIVEITPDGRKRTIFYNQTDWLMQIVGVQESVANPRQVNLLKEAGIEGPDVFSDIWKLRYSETPYGGQAVEQGWAGKLRIPSEGQLQILKGFGILNMSTMIYGDDLYRLLNAMEDPGWVSEYQGK